ncbi:peptidylprolyl isomerase [Phytohabitans aurantiacus]|uniref:peptidylprolyl isomerase n=1 Tax=Phytohabitans aurantiacus TaxID=3016789 RepID=UPI002490EED3|nr:peptidylprolyl isomerase [Phytohabitans aurantiacus]
MTYTPPPQPGQPEPQPDPEGRPQPDQSPRAGQPDQPQPDQAPPAGQPDQPQSDLSYQSQPDPSYQPGQPWTDQSSQPGSPDQSRPDDSYQFGQPDQSYPPYPPGPQQPAYSSQWPAPPGMPPQGPPPGMPHQGPAPGMPPGMPPGMAPQGPPPAKSNRGLVIGLVIGAVVAVLLCAGCVTAGVAYYVTNGDSDSDSGGDLDTAAPAEPSPTTGGAGGACGAQPLAGGSEIKAVGMPDFANAPRTGIATMRITTNLGAITIAMDRAATPCTVASFQHLAAKHFFDGTRCHRLVTEGLSILQCGDPVGDGTGRPDYQFADENLAGAQYTRGIVAMANAGPGTNGSQFFIVFKDGQLNPLYTPFGTVTAGMEVVDQVAAGGHDNSIAGGGGLPKTTITFQGLTVD